MESQRIAVSLFNGQPLKYHEWAAHARSVMRLHKSLGAAALKLLDEPAGTELEDNDDISLNANIHAFLTLCLTDAAAHVVSYVPADDGLALWHALKQKFAPDDATYRTGLVRQLLDFADNVGTSGDVTVWVDNIQAALSRLRLAYPAPAPPKKSKQKNTSGAAAEPDPSVREIRHYEELVVTTAVRRLPPAYASLQTKYTTGLPSWSAFSNDLLALHQLQALPAATTAPPESAGAPTAYAADEHARTSPDPAFSARPRGGGGGGGGSRRFSGRCYNCNRIGHRGSECRSAPRGRDGGPNRSDVRSTPTGGCDFCGRSSHTERECRERANASRRAKEAAGTLAKSSDVTFHVTEMITTELSFRTGIDATSKDFCIDSGCGRHLLNKTHVTAFGDSITTTTVF